MASKNALYMRARISVSDEIPDNDDARRGEDQNPPAPPKPLRLSVNMNPETAEALRELAQGTTVTEAVRRAIAIAHYVAEQAEAGNTFQIRDKKTGAVRELILV